MLLQNLSNIRMHVPLRQIKYKTIHGHSFVGSLTYNEALFKRGSMWNSRLYRHIYIPYTCNFLGKTLLSEQRN